jgi:Fe2+ or Zn2+ uptake regulation protein
MRAATTTTMRRTRNTQQRKAILRAVQTLAGKHPTAADVFVQVRTEYPHMSLATVYRALHALVEQNAVCEMRVENVALYDAGPCPHHHLVCRRCGRVTDVQAEAVPDSVLASVLRTVEPSGFVLDAHPIQFTGLCATCSPPRP